MTALQDRLVLQDFMCREFGYTSIDVMLERLRSDEHPPEMNPNGGESWYAKALFQQGGSRFQHGRSQFAEYDSNVVRHSSRLRMTGAHGRTWKPHQYLALLFTEHYLYRYFEDIDHLCDDLNQARRSKRLFYTLPDYEREHLHTIAFQSATGSGKTLLMHANILQYLHYLKRTGGNLNNIILLTPNEQMSTQHLRDLQDNNLEARIFNSEAPSTLLSTVEILDLNKLAEKKGIKRVAVADFGDDNLVLVDEGHLGASGKIWRERRRELSSGGFTFEYSATFNQVVNKYKKDKALLKSYSKCLIFDYSYRRFYEDGYGKDFTILNLPAGVQDENSDIYLLGCLLSFYQQLRIWRDLGHQWSEFYPEKPLWVLLGKTVVAGSSKADKATQSDVIQIIRFLGWILADRMEVQSMIRSLVSGESGLLNQYGNDFFTDRFAYLSKYDSEGIYNDLCNAIFHGSGRLKVSYLTAGEGELHLKVADGEPFGVINIGDSAKLYKLLSENSNLPVDIEREMGFVPKLFADVDRPNSTVNVVIGARRFIAGWNSWRVSTMGLMHVGVGEGPEIVQMFGRGVRLKGWGMSLKRHRAIGVEAPPDSDKLAELEKLYIFGLRSSYMQTFRDLLEKEGVASEQEVFHLPVTWNMPQDTNLKTIRIRDNQKFEMSTERPELPDPEDHDRPIVRMDMYSKLQLVESGSSPSGDDTRRVTFSLKQYVPFFNTARIYHRVLNHKRQTGWHNLRIPPSTIRRLVGSDDWYELYLPPDRENIISFQQILDMEGIIGDLIIDYAEKFWRRQRRKWEHDQMEVIELGEDDFNKPSGYEIYVEAIKDELISEATELVKVIERGPYDDLRWWSGQLKIGVISVRHHVYQPLLYAVGDKVVTVRPLPLDSNERRFVDNVERLASGGDPLLNNLELFLIRNTAGHGGISFFNDFRYFPDFVIWLKDGDLQHILFLDPKGLGILDRRARSKIELHREISVTEDQIRKIDPNLRLHAYIISHTPASEIDDGIRSPREWNQDGVYFVNQPDYLKQIIEHALSS